MSAVVPGTLKIDDVTYIDKYYEYANGGYFRMTSDRYFDAEPVDYDTGIYYFCNFTKFKFNSADNLMLTIEFGGEDGIEENRLAPSRVLLECKDAGTTKRLPVSDWTTDYSVPFNRNLSGFISDNGFTEATDCKVFVEMKAIPNVNTYSYILIKSVLLESEVEDEAQQTLLGQISFDDANLMAGTPRNSDNRKNLTYWQSTATKNVWHAERRKVSFVYDKYADILGDQYGFVVGESIFKQYIKKGWCEFTDFSDVSTFKVLDEKNCPVLEVYSGSFDAKDQVWQFETHLIYYKYIGYKTMPKFLFGTTNNGYDLLTLAFSCLKTSLLVAIISSAACLAIGLVWGSVSGYFGGTVDLVMERVTDIISGVPWIVMMTLIILLLGNNVVTFAIALIMTGWISTASRTRTQFYRFKGREYVLASRTLGASDARLIFRHILPNGSGTIVTGSVLMIPGCIFSEASISYLGLGLKGVNSFGVLMSRNQMYLSSRPMLVILPAIIISLLMISFNLFGNGLRDALNPTLKGGEQ